MSGELIRYAVIGCMTLIASIAAGWIMLGHLPIVRKKDERERHHHKVIAPPRIGGFILWSAMTAGCIALVGISRELIGMLIASLVILIAGAVDDRRRLSVSAQLFWQIIAVLIVILGGIGVEYITNPFGSFIWLNGVRAAVFTINGGQLEFTLFADLFTILWLGAMMNITNWIDGIDGLAPSIGSVAAIVIFLLSLKPTIDQPETATLALILGMALIGVIFWNRYPAKLELGTQGSMLVGFYLGVLAIYSGSKIATTLLVMGLPMLDGAWVIMKRLVKKRPIWQADRSHLHHTLLSTGFTHGQVVGIMTIIATGFGIIALVTQLREKAVSFLLLLCTVAALAFGLSVKKWKYKHHHEHEHHS